MDRETAKAIVKDREPDFLDPAPKRINGQTSYICPVCGNGEGSNGTGIALDVSSKTRRYKCFRCGLSEDVIGLWKHYKGLNGDAEAFNSLYEYYGLQVDNGRPTEKEAAKPAPEYQKQAKNEQYTQNDVHTSAYTQEELNTIAYCEECSRRISSTDYPKKRGISEELVAKFKLGYDPQYCRGTGGKAWKALIIPTGPNSYVARNTAPDAEKENRYRKKGESKLFNVEAIREAQKPVFVVEGELDALSIMSVGGEAIALGSTSNWGQLVKQLMRDAQKPDHPLIVALDNDPEGEKTAEKLVAQLELVQVSFYRLNVYGDKKDANEALLADRESFAMAVAEAEKVEKEALEAEKEAYLQTSTAYHLQDFINGIANSVNTPYTPTGFKNLDSILEGGLFEGLYFIGAISSLGKTTLVLQIADQIAEAGGEVLIFSLEMARSELMAKSISRMTILDVMQNNGQVMDAKTTRGITTGSRYAYYSQTEKELIQRAIVEYGEFAGNVYIHEGIGDIGTAEIRETVRKHILFTGRKPVVVIDYLQILAPADVRATDKQNTDKAVMELKRISRDYKIPVVGISSFNRVNYKEKVSMEAFKESGAIEYSSDILIGLQLKGAGTKDFDANMAKQKNPREIELVILKNRNGATGGTVEMQYYPLFNYFKEV